MLADSVGSWWMLRRWAAGVSDDQPIAEWPVTLDDSIPATRAEGREGKIKSYRPNYIEMDSGMDLFR